MDSKEKEISLHRLSKEDEERIYDLIDSRLMVSPSDNAQVCREKENRREALEAFKLRITPKKNNKPRQKRPGRLCYENLPELLNIAGLTYLDVLKGISKNQEGTPIEPQWASEVEATMCSCCDILSSDQRQKVLALIRRILAPAFQNSGFETMTPPQRLFKANALRSYCNREVNRQTKELGVYDIYLKRLLRYNYNTIEMNLISFFSSSFDVSPHWVLGLDESQTVLAAHGESEMIMDLFCLLPEERKQMILQAVQTAIEKGGTM